MSKILFIGYKSFTKKIDLHLKEILNYEVDIVEPTKITSFDKEYLKRFELIIICDPNIEPENKRFYEEIIQELPFIPIIPLGGNLLTNMIFNVEAQVAQKLNSYFVYGGEQNIKNMIKFMGASELGMSKDYIEEPVKTPFNGILHHNTNEIYFTFQEYIEAYDKKYKSYVGILIHRNDWLNSNLEVVKAIAENLEKRNIGVICVFMYASTNEDIESSSFQELVEKYFSYNHKLQIDMLINLTIMTEPVKTPGQSSFHSMVENYRIMNIPVIKPIGSFTLTEEKWMDNNIPLTYEMSYNYTNPEQMGAIEPIFISCQSDEGERTFVKERVNKLINKVEQYINLKHKNNSEKKIGIMLHNAPCSSVESTLGIGAGLDVFESTIILMNYLKSQGYYVESIPKKGEDLRRLFMEKKAYSDFRWTSVEDIVHNGGAIYEMSLEKYLQYFEKLEKEQRDNIESLWEKAPGNSMVLNEKIVITGLNFGNVELYMQPKRGCYGAKCTGEVCLILQDPTAPPSHQFIATYRYIEDIFKADALIDIGTHGAVEFLPGKSVALSKKCYPDTVMGNLLSLYIYNSAVGTEGLLAKRRMGSVIIDHFPEIIENDYKSNHVLGKIYGLNECISIIKEVISSEAGLLELQSYSEHEVEDLIKSHLSSEDNCNDYVCNYIKEIYSRLHSMDKEIINIVRALNCEYIEPVKYGVPEDQGLDMMPTGGNFYTFDDRKIPTKEAYENGTKLGDNLIEEYKKSSEELPKKIAMNLISTDISQNKGEQVSQILYLLGTKPIWDKNQNVIGLEIIPLNELNRPRIDVTIRISGVLRDSHPKIIEFIDSAIEAVCNLQEDEHENYVIKNSKTIKSNLQNTGVEGDLERYSKIRIFGDKPGAYGAGVDLALKASSWKEKEELAQVFVQHSAYAYGKNLNGERKTVEFIENARHVDVSYDSTSSKRYSVLGSSFGAAVNGGYYLIKKHYGEGELKQFAANRADKSDFKVTSLKEAVNNRVLKTLNSEEWRNHVVEKGYDGTIEVLNSVQNVFEWKCLNDIIEDKDIDEIVENYLNNKEIKEWFREINPYAFEEMARRMLELKQRSLWKGNDEIVKKLIRSYVDIEGELEGTVGSQSTDIQGGNIEIITSDEISVWKNEMNNIKEYFKKIKYL